MHPHYSLFIFHWIVRTFTREDVGTREWSSFKASVRLGHYWQALKRKRRSLPQSITSDGLFVLSRKKLNYYTIRNFQHFTTRCIWKTASKKLEHLSQNVAFVRDRDKINKGLQCSHCLVWLSQCFSTESCGFHFRLCWWQGVSLRFVHADAGRILYALLLANQKLKVCALIWNVINLPEEQKAIVKISKLITLNKISLMTG